MSQIQHLLFPDASRVNWFGTEISQVAYQELLGKSQMRQLSNSEKWGWVEDVVLPLLKAT